MQNEEFPGDLETHITVRLDDGDRITALQQWAVEHGVKCLHIVLDRGDSASQPMLTRHGYGHLSDERATAYTLSEELNAAGFPVTRIKIEAAPWNEGIPQSETEAMAHPPDRYFEHHIKLLLPPGADTAVLAEIAERHTAHLSRNALKFRDDGYQERFITQRCYSVGRPESRKQLDTLLEAVTPIGHPVLKVEEEFVVFDTNLELDAGWIHTRPFHNPESHVSPAPS